MKANYIGSMASEFLRFIRIEMNHSPFCEEWLKGSILLLTAPWLHKLLPRVIKNLAHGFLRVQ